MARNIIKKVCLLGDGAVGKTSLIRKYVYDDFDDNLKPDIQDKRKPLSYRQADKDF